MRACQLLRIILWSREAPTYDITGSIVDGDSTGIEGVTVTLSGDADDSTTTSGGGAYSFTDLPNGNYTITPSSDNYSFTPTSDSVEIADENVAVDDIVGSGALELPWQLTFDTSDPITGGQVPVFDDDTWEEKGSPIGPTVENVTTLNNYDPSSLFNRQLNVRTGAALQFPGFSYMGLRKAGRYFPTDGGLRICLISGMSGTDDRHNPQCGIWSGTEADHTVRESWFDFRSNTKNNPDQWDAWWGNASGSGRNISGTSTTVNAPTHYVWTVTTLEIPADFSGNLTYGYKWLGTGSTTLKTTTTAMPAGFSAATVLDSVLYQGGNNLSTATPLFGMIWVGSSTDDWPV